MSGTRLTPRPTGRILGAMSTRPTACRLPVPVLLLALAAGLAGGPALADGTLPGIRLDGTAPEAPAEPPALRSMSAPELAAALRRAPDARAARPYQRELDRRRAQSGSDTVDLLMDQALRATRNNAPGRALDLLDAALRLRPAFSEAYVRRALVRFQTSDNSGAIEDLSRALEADPDNWDAYEGIAAVFIALGDDVAAAAAYDQALAINPWLSDAREARENLVPEVDGREI